MTDNIEDKYPSWRDALFGDHDAVANIRCAIHYIFWHAAYALIAVAGLIVVGTIIAVSAVVPSNGWADTLTEKVVNILEHRHTQTVSEIMLGIGLIFIIGTLGYITIMIALQDPFLLLQGIGYIVGGIIISIFVLYVADILADPAKNAANKATETPFINRIYGKCPVSVNVTPKWFDNLFDDGDDL